MGLRRPSEALDWLARRLPPAGGILRPKGERRSVRWWSGGTFGPKGSIAVVLVEAATFAATMAILRRGPQSRVEALSTTGKKRNA